MGGFYVIVELDCNWVFRGPRNSIKVLNRQANKWNITKFKQNGASYPFHVMNDLVYIGTETTLSLNAGSAILVIKKPTVGDQLW